MDIFPICQTSVAQERWIPNWTGRPNPEGRINRQPKDHKWILWSYSVHRFGHLVKNIWPSGFIYSAIRFRPNGPTSLKLFLLVTPISLHWQNFIPPNLAVVAQWLKQKLGNLQRQPSYSDPGNLFAINASLTFCKPC